jgi:nifR3 family TIM-barrel protein
VVKAVKKPVTVKTRLGYDNENKNIVEIAERMQDCGIQAITIHGRTRPQRSSEPADWSLIRDVKLNPRMKIPVIGNGDIFSPESAKYFKENFAVDGLMVARGSYGNPWIFREIKHYLETGETLAKPDIHERVRVCLIHLERSVDWKGERQAINEIRKHYSDYFKGYPNFKPFRIKLMEADSFEKVDATLNDIEQEYLGVIV